MHQHTLPIVYLWSLSSHAIKHLQIAINKILRRIWHLPRNSHTSIVLKTSNISFVQNIILKRFEKFVSLSMESDNPIVKFIICDSSNLAYSSIGYNCMYGHLHVKHFSEHDLYVSSVIRFYRHVYGLNSHFESCIIHLSS